MMGLAGATKHWVVKERIRDGPVSQSQRLCSSLDLLFNFYIDYVWSWPTN